MSLVDKSLCSASALFQLDTELIPLSGLLIFAAASWDNIPLPRKTVELVLSRTAGL